MVQIQVYDFSTADKNKQTLKELVYDTIKKLNTIEEGGITKRFNVMDIYHTRIHVKKNYRVYIKYVLDRNSWDNPGNE